MTGLPETHAVISPVTGQQIAEVPRLSAVETDAAVERAHDAFLSWRQVGPGERAGLLRAFASVVDAHVEELAELEVRNAGHTISNARGEAGNVRDCLNYYAGAPERVREIGKHVHGRSGERRSSDCEGQLG